MTVPIGHIVPLGNENRWSDLLAVLIETDPESVGQVLGLGEHPADVKVVREAPASGRDRIDLLVYGDGVLRAIVEVKVLSGLGSNQLGRYYAAYPSVALHLLVYPQRLAIDIGAQPDWHGVTWEHLLGLFTLSTNDWVRTTAHAWVDHLEATVPIVDAGTAWSALRDGEDFVIALRARMSWVFAHLNPPEPIAHDLVSSSAGVSWVARMYVPATVDGYRIIVEAEENLPVRDYPTNFDAARNRLRGPSIKVCLLQYGVTTSAGFDWDYLLAMWPYMLAARSDWVSAAARPKAAHDRAARQAMVAKGGPAYLGIGFGEAQARSSGECMFGARIQLAKHVSLGGVVSAMNQTASLMLSMAAVGRPGV